MQHGTALRVPSPMFDLLWKLCNPQPVMVHPTDQPMWQYLKLLLAVKRQHAAARMMCIPQRLISAVIAAIVQAVAACRCHCNCLGFLTAA